jgi:Na+-translocating ferredoxin:NAD+ oxidoreductase subunit C
VVDYVFEKHLTGGILLPANKTTSTATPIRRGFVPRQLMLALRQHRGAPAEAVVAVGERVLKGQLVARAAFDGPSAAVHASTSGVVRAIEERAVLAGNGVQLSQCIVIEADGRDESVPASERPSWPATADEQRAAVRAGGIVGLGGAVYPTADKLATPVPCKTLIVNGAECEPYISCDDMLMRENAAEVVAGALLLTEILAAPRCIIAIERDKPQAMEAIEAAARAIDDPRLKLAEVPTIYPAGGERQLVELLTGEEVPSGHYPGEFGYVCQNVGTAYAVHRLSAEREPLTSRIVTITGGGVRAPQNVEAPIGTPLAELIGLCGGYGDDVVRLIAGGSMMGYALPDDDVPTTKATNCIIAATAAEVRLDSHEWACIRCGDCALVCPSRLLPQDLLVAATTSDFGALATLGLQDCIECGCCDVVCPSHIMLVERFRIAKRAVAADEPILVTTPGQD